MRRTCRPLTLLEVMIGCTLTAILITALFSTFRQTTLMQARVAKARVAVHEECALSLRLSQVMADLDGEVFRIASHPESDCLALFFTFDNGVDHDPYLCSDAFGALYLDREGAVCLSTERKEHKRTEQLAKGVDAFTIAVFDLEKKAWGNEWEGKELPLYIRVSIDGKDYLLAPPSPFKMVSIS